MNHKAGSAEPTLAKYMCTKVGLVVGLSQRRGTSYVYLWNETSGYFVYETQLPDPRKQRAIALGRLIPLPDSAEISSSRLHVIGHCMLCGATMQHLTFQCPELSQSEEQEEE